MYEVHSRKPWPFFVFPNQVVMRFATIYPIGAAMGHNGAKVFFEVLFSFLSFSNFIRWLLSCVDNFGKRCNTIKVHYWSRIKIVIWFECWDSNLEWNLLQVLWFQFLMYILKNLFNKSLYWRFELQFNLSFSLPFR